MGKQGSMAVVVCALLAHQGAAFNAAPLVKEKGMFTRATFYEGNQLAIVCTSRPKLRISRALWSHSLSTSLRGSMSFHEAFDQQSDDVRKLCGFASDEEALSSPSIADQKGSECWYQALVSWVETAGGQVHTAVQVIPEDRGAGRGLIVKREVQKGEQLIVVPQVAQLSVGNKGESASDKALLTLINAVNPKVHGMRLALRLLQEKLKSETPSGSYFGNYLSSLPLSQPLPMYYAEDIPEIQFSNVEQEAVAAITELLRVTQTCLSVQGTHADPFKGAFTDVGPLLWATAAASSRAFRVGVCGGEEAEEALIPLIDLINHSFDANCVLHLLNASSGAVAVTALRHIRAGESVRLNYGNMSSDAFLLRYGFVPDDNPHDRLVLPAGALSYALQESIESFQRALALNETEDFLSASEAALLSATQLRLLQDAHLGDTSTIVFRHTGELEVHSMGLVRVLALRSPAEALGVGSLLQTLDEVVEGRARDAVRRLCLMALKQLPTSLAHDMRLVHGDGGVHGANAPEDGQLVLWEGKTRDELGAAMTAVLFRLAHKQILSRAALFYT